MQLKPHKHLINPISLLLSPEISTLNLVLFQYICIFMICVYLIGNTYCFALYKYYFKKHMFIFNFIFFTQHFQIFFHVDKTYLLFICFNISSSLYDISNLFILLLMIKHLHCFQYMIETMLYCILMGFCCCCCLLFAVLAIEPRSQSC